MITFNILNNAEFIFNLSYIFICTKLFKKKKKKKKKILVDVIELMF